MLSILDYKLNKESYCCCYCCC